MLRRLLLHSQHGLSVAFSLTGFRYRQMKELQKGRHVVGTCKKHAALSGAYPVLLPHQQRNMDSLLIPDILAHKPVGAQHLPVVRREHNQRILLHLLLPKITEYPPELPVNSVHRGKILSGYGLHLWRAHFFRHIGTPSYLQIPKSLIIVFRHQLIGQVRGIIGHEKRKGFIALPVAFQIFKGFVRLIFRRPFPRTNLPGRVRPVVRI